MMNKFTSIAFLIILLIIGYNAIGFQNQYYQHREWLMNEAENSFNYEAFLMTDELKQIYLTLMDIGTIEKRSYALGRIDSHLANDPYHEIQRILNPDNISEELADDILDPSLRMPIKELIYNSRKHLEAIREELAEAKDIDNLRKMNVKFYEISSLLKELDFGSSDSLTDESIVGEYLEKLEKLNTILAQDF